MWKKYVPQNFLLIFCHNMPLPRQHTFRHCQKMCCSHFQVCQISFEMPQNVEYDPQICPLNFCHYHGHAFSDTVRKCVARIFTSRPTCVPSLNESHESIMIQSQGISEKNLGLTFCTQVHGQRDHYH